jgi:hypothetical protein
MRKFIMRMLKNNELNNDYINVISGENNNDLIIENINIEKQNRVVNKRRFDKKNSVVENNNDLIIENINMVKKFRVVNKRRFDKKNSVVENNNNDIVENINMVKKNSIVENNNNDIVENINNKFDFIVVTSNVVKSIAFNLKSILDELNYNVDIIYDLTIDECINNDTSMYIIIYNSATHNHLPKKFILYQIEQNTSHHFTDKFYDMVNKCMVLWDFSISNKKIYGDKIGLNKIFYLPFPLHYTNELNNEELEYDILFFGACNDRRMNILNTIAKKYNIKICYGVFDEELKKYIKKSKIIINMQRWKYQE